MADLLRVTCHGCATCFVSAHQALRAVLAAGEVTHLVERCPHCGTSGTYTPAHYDRGPLTGPVEPLCPPRR